MAITKLEYSYQCDQCVVQTVCGLNNVVVDEPSKFIRIKATGVIVYIFSL